MCRYSFVLAALLAPAVVAAPESKMLLRQNWAIQSSADVPESGAALSIAGFRPPRAWYPATVPTTVFSALVADARLSRPVLRHEPALRAGRQVPHRLQLLQRAHAARQPVPQPVVVSHRVQAAGGIPRQDLWLDFDGINFRANVG